MKPSYRELWTLIDGLEEDFDNFQAVRRLKVDGRALEQERAAEVTA